MRIDRQAGQSMPVVLSGNPNEDGKTVPGVVDKLGISGSFRRSLLAAAEQGTAASAPSNKYPK